MKSVLWIHSPIGSFFAFNSRHLLLSHFFYSFTSAFATLMDSNGNLNRTLLFQMSDFLGKSEEWLLFFERFQSDRGQFQTQNTSQNMYLLCFRWVNFYHRYCHSCIVCRQSVDCVFCTDYTVDHIQHTIMWGIHLIWFRKVSPASCTLYTSRLTGASYFPLFLAKLHL